MNSILNITPIIPLNENTYHYVSGTIDNYIINKSANVVVLFYDINQEIASGASSGLNGIEFEKWGMNIADPNVYLRSYITQCCGAVFA